MRPWGAFFVFAELVTGTCGGFVDREAAFILAMFHGLGLYSTVSCLEERSRSFSSLASAEITLFESSFRELSAQSESESESSSPLVARRLKAQSEFCMFRV